MIMTELKPCPFCGCSPRISEIAVGTPYDGGFVDYRMTIECSCGVTFETEYTGYPNGFIWPCTTVDAWNRRAGDE